MVLHGLTVLSTGLNFSIITRLIQDPLMFPVRKASARSVVARPFLYFFCMAVDIVKVIVKQSAKGDPSADPLP